MKEYKINNDKQPIPPKEVISLETIRQGLRSDTLMDFVPIKDPSFQEMMKKNSISNEEK